MAITNPSTLLASFDLNETNISAPAAAQIADGYVVNEIPLSENHGYMFNEWYKWINYYKKNGMAQYDATLSYNKHSRTMRNQNIYRSLSDANSGNDPLTSPTFWVIDQWRMNTVTHDMTSDGNYTLTDEQNNFGKIIITDTNPFLTVPREIIVSDEEKDFIFHNGTLETLTPKTSGGTGIAVVAGAKVWLLCDGTNVIDAIDSAGLSIASTAEAQAGTDDTKAISPLKLHEAMLGSDSQQAWIDVAGSRVAGTTYTNTTGRPFFVNIRGDGASKFAIVDSVNVGSFGSVSNNIGFIVPDNSTYSVTSATTIALWAELR